MSFLNPEKRASQSDKIHVRTYSWSGGEKKIDPNNAAAGKKAFVEIRYYEGSGQDKIKSKLDTTSKTIALIGMTFSVGGFDSRGTKESQVSYFSNETTTDRYGQILKVFKRDANGVELVMQAPYRTAKDKLGKLVHAEYNAYFYDFDRKCIDRFKFAGSAYTEWDTFVKQIGDEKKYSAPIKISEGEAKEFPTGITIVPKFELQAPYTEAQLAEIRGIAPRMDEYEAALEREQREMEAELEQNQTPAQYEGEGSQELPDASTAAVDASMEDVPF